MLELQSKYVPLIQPSMINSYLLAYKPEAYLTHETLCRCVRKNLNSLTEDGYLKKLKFCNNRTIYSLTDSGVKLAKEL